MSDEKDSTQTHRRSCSRGFTSRAREMGQGNPSTELAKALCRMLLYLFSVTPDPGALAQLIYLAIGRAWMDYRYRNGRIDEGWDTDPAEQAIVELHGLVIAAHKKREAGKPEQTRKEFDAKLWERICANHHTQKLIEKVNRINKEASKQRRALFIEALTIWARHTPVLEYFPDTADLCTPEAILRMSYCNQAISAGAYKQAGAYFARMMVVVVGAQVVRKEPVAKIKENIVGWLRDVLSEESLKKREEPMRKTPTSDGGETLAALEARLEQLKRYGDITDSTDMFRLEGEIERLKNKLGDDEWPDVIDDKGAIK